jgi:hypothetical protein
MKESMMFEHAFRTLYPLLIQRLEQGTRLIESDLQAEFSLALVIAGIQHCHLLPEVRHPLLMNGNADGIRRLDLVVAANLLDQEWHGAFEFKRHREVGQGLRPRRSGALFADLLRLAAIPSQTCQQRFLVYVTDHEMQGYLAGDGRHVFLRSLVSDQVHHELPDVQGLLNAESPTFTEAVHGSLGPIAMVEELALGTVFRCDELPGGNSLRVYRIQ